MADEDLGELSVTLRSIDGQFKSSMKDISGALDTVAGKMSGLPTDKLTKNFISARTAMRDLGTGARATSEAFDLFTGKSKLTIDSLMGFGHLLPALSSPLGALITALGAAAGAAFKLKQAN